MMNKKAQAFKKLLGERNSAQQLYYGVCEVLDQQCDETIKVKEERNKFRKERDQLKQQISDYEGEETTNSEVWAELIMSANSQSMIEEMEKDYEKRKRKIKDIDEISTRISTETN